MITLQGGPFDGEQVGKPANTTVSSTQFHKDVDADTTAVYIIDFDSGIGVFSHVINYN